MSGFRGVLRTLLCVGLTAAPTLALAAPDLVGRADAARRSGRSAEARTLYTEALTVATPAARPELLARLADLTARAGEAAEARRLVDQCIAEARALDDLDAEGIALRTLSLLASNAGELDTARAHDWEALALHESTGNRAELLQDRLYLAADEYDRTPDTALALYLDAVEEAAALAEGAAEAKALQGAALVLYRYGELDWAETLLGQAMALQKTLGDAPGLERSEGYRLSLLSLAGRHEDVARQAAELLGRHLADPVDRRVARIVGARSLETLGRLAEARALLGPELATPAPGDPETRRHEALLLGARLARRSGDAVEAARLLRGAKALPPEAPESQIELAAEEAAAALETGDRRRAASLLETAAALLADIRREASVGRPEAFFDLGNTVELRALVRLHAELGDAAGVLRAGELLKSASFAAATARDRFATSGRGRDDRFRLAGQLQAASPEGNAPLPGPGQGLAALQAALPAGTALLDFLVLEDEVVGVWVGGGRVALRRHPIDRARLVTQITALESQLVARGPGDPALLQGLSATLVEPFAELFAEVSPEILMVVPHEILHRLPFELLSVGGEMLADTLAVGTLPTPALLQRAAGRGGVGGGPAVVVGNPDATLPASETEAREVAAALGVAPLVRKAATESVVLAALSGASIVHLATHAYQSPDRGASYLQFADARTPVWRIREQGLGAELVVLSACETGVGTPTAGDEVPLALDRAFLAAGARRVIASRWPVDDAATSALMKAFYRGLPGVSPVVALARAARSLRAPESAEPVASALLAPQARGMVPLGTDSGRAPRSRPYYWAAFRFVGDPRPWPIGSHVNGD
jgi:CHAT domain-containing protein